MPTYNRRNCIKEAIDSLLSQTYQDFELIIVDDGSTDGTEDYIKHLYNKEILENKIKYITLEGHKGVSFARNVGLENAKNEWIGYLDTDNTMFENFLESFVDAIENNPQNKVFYSQVEQKISGFIFGGDFNFNSLLKCNLIDNNALVHNIDLYKELGGFDNNLDRLVDWDLVIKYTEKYKPFFIKKPLIHYYDGKDFNRITNIKTYNINYKKIIINHFKRISEDKFEEEYQGDFLESQTKDKIILDKDKEIREKENFLIQKEKIIKEIKIEVENLKNEISSKIFEINLLRNSTSWKITKPLRIVFDWFKNFYK